MSKIIQKRTKGAGVKRYEDGKHIPSSSFTINKNKIAVQTLRFLSGLVNVFELGLDFAAYFNLDWPIANLLF